MIVVGKIKDIRHSPVGVGCSDGPISLFMLTYAVLAEGGWGVGGVGVLVDLIFVKESLKK